jgi:hypothetical protein
MAINLEVIAKTAKEHAALMQAPLSKMAVWHAIDQHIDELEKEIGCSDRLKTVEDKKAIRALRKEITEKILSE